MSDKHEVGGSTPPGPTILFFLKLFVTFIDETLKIGVSCRLEFTVQHPKFLTKYKIIFYSCDDAENSFLIRQLFDMPFGIKKIEIEDNKLILNLENSLNHHLDILKKEVVVLIAKHFKSGLTLFDEAYMENQLENQKETYFKDQPDNNNVNKRTSASGDYNQDTNSDNIKVLSVEPTPNPQAFKFVVNKKLNQPGAYFDSIETATNSKLARAIFHVPTVMSVFFGQDFITILASSLEKEDETSIINIIQQFKDSVDEVVSINTAELSEVEKEIVKILDSMIRPSVQMDGGDIIYKSFKDGIVTLELLGACVGCPSSTITLKQGIERTLKHYIKEVIEVVSA